MPLDDYDDTISDNDDEQENMYPSSQRQVRHNRGNLIVNNSIIYSSSPPPVEPSINKRSSSRVTDSSTEIFDNGLSKTSTLPPSAPPVSDHERDSSPDLLIQSREGRAHHQRQQQQLRLQSQIPQKQSNSQHMSHRKRNRSLSRTYSEATTCDGEFSDHGENDDPDKTIVNEREQAMDKYLNMGKNTYAEDDEVCIRRSSKRTKVSVVEKGIAVL